MKSSRELIALVLALTTLTVVACGGDDDDEDATTTPAPAEVPTTGGAQRSPSALPPELVQCFADQGFELSSPAEIHSAPPQVIQQCFGALHQGGGVP